MTNFKKLIAMLLVVMMIATMFAGCKKAPAPEKPSEEPSVSEVPEQEPEEEPKTAKEILDEVYANTKEEESFSLEMLMKVVMEVSMEGTKMSTEINMVGNIDSQRDPEIARATMKMSFMGQNQESESFTVREGDDYYNYLKAEDSDVYTRSKLDEKPDGINIEKSQEEFQKIDWDVEETDSEYILSKTLTKEDSDKLTTMSENVGSIASDSNNLAGCKMKLTVEKDSMLIKEVEMDMVTLMKDQFGEMEGANVEITEAVMKMTYDFDKEFTLEVPKNVVDEEADEPEGSENGETPEGTDEPENSPIPAISGTPDPNAGSEPATGKWTDGIIKVDGVDYRLFDSFSKFQANGWDFDLADYGKDSYILNPGDKVVMTIELYNEKFGDDYKAPHLTVGFVNNGDVAKEIKECDIWALKADTSYIDEPVENGFDFSLPCGLKRGMTLEEVYKILGEPDPKDVYESTAFNYTSVEYSVDYRQYLTVTVLENGGLQTVEMKDYGE